MKQYIVLVNVPHYCGRQRAQERDAIARRNTRAIRAFKNDVTGLLQSKALPADSVTFLSVIEGQASVLVGCSKEVAAELKGLRGVSSVERNRTIPLPRDPMMRVRPILKE